MVWGVDPAKRVVIWKVVPLSQLHTSEQASYKKEGDEDGDGCRTRNRTKIER